MKEELDPPEAAEEEVDPFAPPPGPPPFPVFEAFLKSLLLSPFLLVTVIAALFLPFAWMAGIVPLWGALCGAGIPLSYFLLGQQKFRRNYFKTFALCLVASAFDFLVLPNVSNPLRPEAAVTTCHSNLKNLGTACEMWSTDNKGRYPSSLSQLTPNYLKTLPTCPRAGADSYSPSYRSATGPDLYTMFCTGTWHKDVGVPTDYPQFTAVQGLILK